MGRLLRVVSSQFDAPKRVELEDNTTTWGELKLVLASQGITYNGMAANVKETRNTLDLDSAVLPESDFALFLSPSKVKSGNIDSNIPNEVEAESFQVLRSFATAVGINAGSNPTKSDLAARIAAFNIGRGVNATDLSTGINSEELEAANKSLIEAIEEIRDISISVIEDVVASSSDSEGMSQEDIDLMNEFNAING